MTDTTLEAWRSRALVAEQPVRNVEADQSRLMSEVDELRERVETLTNFGEVPMLRADRKVAVEALTYYERECAHHRGGSCDCLIARTALSKLRGEP